MHVTHERCVESGRCSACGAMPTLNSAAGQQDRGRAASAIVATSEPRPTSGSRGTMSIAKNHRNSDFCADNAGSFHHGGTSSAIACSDPSRCAPRRRSRKLATGAEFEDGVDHHAAECRARADQGDVHPHRQQSDDRGEHRRSSIVDCATGTSRRRGSTRARGRAGTSTPVRPTHRRRSAKRRGLATVRARSANTMLHRHRAMPPFHAIAVRPIGVST